MIDLGVALSIPAGYHNGGGKVTASGLTIKQFYIAETKWDGTNIRIRLVYYECGVKKQDSQYTVYSNVQQDKATTFHDISFYYWSGGYWRISFSGTFVSLSGATYSFLTSDQFVYSSYSKHVYTNDAAAISYINNFRNNINAEYTRIYAL